MTTKEFKLTEAQIRMFKEAAEASNKAAQSAQILVEMANVKRKALNDLITLYCEVSGLNLSTTTIDVEKGIAVEAESPEA